MDNKTLLSEINNGNKSAIIDGLNHFGAIYRINAIIGIVKNNIVDDSIFKRIKELKNDDDIVLYGYSVSDFAFSALDLLKSEKYIGNSKMIKQLIECRMQF